MEKYKYDTGESEEIIFRNMSLDEAGRFYNAIAKSKDIFAEEYIFNIITDHQYKTDDLPAGTIPTVIFLSFKVSGLFKEPIDIPNKIDETRKEMGGNSYYMMYSTIAKTQPGYTLDMLKSKSTNELLELFVFAEMILGAKEIDTDKTREALKPEISAKGVKGVTKDEIAWLTAMLDSQEHDGVLLDEYKL